MHRPLTAASSTRLLVEDITEAEIQGRRQVREYARFFKDRLVGCENSFVNDTGVQVGVRQSRQISRRGVVSANDDVASAARKAQEISIARSAWPIELHSGEKPRLVWLLDDYYDVAFRKSCFLPRTGEGFYGCRPLPVRRARGYGVRARHRAVLLLRSSRGSRSGNVGAIGQVAARAAGVRSAQRAPPRWRGHLT